MKKFLAALMAALLVLSMSLTAVADITESSGTEERNYEITTTLEGEYGIVYSIEIVWESLTFEYVKYASNYTWDPASHAYLKVADTSDDTEVDHWVLDDDDALDRTIEVINHSNASLNVQTGFVAEDGTTLVDEVTADGVTLYCSLGGQVLELFSAENYSVNEPPYWSFTIMVNEDGVPTKEYITGTVKVVITPYTESEEGA